MALWQQMFIELFSIMFVVFTIESIATIIPIKQWNVCPPSESKIEYFLGVSVHTCSKNCNVTQSCLSFNYFPRGKLCELLANDSLIVKDKTTQRPCLHGTPSKKKFVCYESNGDCTVKACRKTVVANAAVFGNIYTVGSRMKVECYAGYRTDNDTLPIVCGNDGTWTNIPTCSAICGEEPFALPNAVMGPRKPTERYYKCNDGFGTSMNTTYTTTVCQSNGTWTSPTSGCINNTADTNGATSYMFGFLSNINHHKSVYVLPSNPTTINISSPLQFYWRNIKVTNGTEIEIPLNLLRPDDTGIFQNGFRLESNAPIEIYVENGGNRSSDGSVVIPEKRLSTEYILLSWNEINKYAFKAEFAVVGTVNDTNVSVSFPNGSMYTFYLDRYQVYNYQTQDELSGTIIHSSKNIAVFAGHKCSYVMKKFCDHLYEQMPPVSDLQTEFIVSYPYPRYKYIFRITTFADKTKIELSNGMSNTLDRAKYWQQEINGKPIYIRATYPILVAVYSLGLLSEPKSFPEYFDGSMLILPGLSQFKSEYNIFVPESVTRCVLMVTYPSYISSIHNIRLNHMDFIAKESVDVMVKGRVTYTVLYTDLFKGSSIIYTTDGTPFGAYLSFFRPYAESWFSLPYRF